ncbi:MAG: hypothetical protein WCJ03_01720 [Bacteroidales bacterium]
MKNAIFYLMLFQVLSLFSQVNSRNGYYFKPEGTYRAFIVFAEVLNDPYDGGTLTVESMGDWLSGSMPPNIDKLIDHQFTDPQSIQGSLTKYFYDSSMGKLKFIGDYYPQLVQINYNSLAGGYGTSQVINYLNNLPGSDIITKNGYSINSGAFDIWSIQSNAYGQPKSAISDGKIDLLMIFWRTNSNLDKDRQGGQMVLNNLDFPIKQKSGFNSYSYIVAGDIIPTFRHEFAHTILGLNEFHSGIADGGLGNFLSSIGGYSILSGTAKNLESVNGCDRWRLGWIPDTNHYEIAVRTIANLQTQGDLNYLTMPSSSEYILRDFATTGDAMRIKLPYLQSINGNTKNQYIWIENHQLKSDQYESKFWVPISKGIRLNIQVGNDDTLSFSSRTNSITPISSFGKYDYSYVYTDFDGTNYNFEATTTTQLSNPLSGYSLLEQPAIDFPQFQMPKDKNGNILLQDKPNMIFNREFIIPRKVTFDNNVIFSQAPINTCNTYDVFSVARKLNIGGNPSSSPLLSYGVNNRMSISYADTIGQNDNNRFIFLNGLSIEVLEQKANGDIRIRIRKDDYDINNNVRWCGPIVLNEKIYLKANKTITFDQGQTPTRPIKTTAETYFADPTLFTAKSGSLFRLEANSNVVVKNNSALVFESGSTLEVNTGAKLTVKAGSTLQIKSGDTIKVIGIGQINIESGGYICIESGAIIVLQDPTSFINLQMGSLSGTNTAVIPSATCTSAAAASKSGNGQINDYNTDLYIQNQTISSGKYYAGKNIYVAGSGGAVLINNNASVTFDAAQDVLFQNGFDVSPGASFEVVKH